MKLKLFGNAHEDKDRVNDRRVSMWSKVSSFAKNIGTQCFHTKEEPQLSKLDLQSSVEPYFKDYGLHRTSIADSIDWIYEVQEFSYSLVDSTLVGDSELSRETSIHSIKSFRKSRRISMDTIDPGLLEFRDFIV